MRSKKIKVLLFLASFEVTNTVSDWFPYLTRFPVSFAIAPIVQYKEVKDLKEYLHSLRTKSRLPIYPVIVKMPNINLRNALNLKLLLNDVYSIYKAFVLSKPDIVVCFYVKHAYPLFILKKLLGFRLCVYAMGDDINLGRSVIENLLRKIVYIHSDKILAVSEDLKIKIQKVHNIEVDVIPIGTNVDFFKPLQNKFELRQKWGLNPTDLVILTVCRLDKRKGIDLLIKSVAKFKNDNVKLLIAGEGKEAISLRALAERLRINKRVSFLGFRTKEELRELYNLADLFVLASYSEGLPRALLEAMSCGCVCIATKVGGITEVIKDFYNGFLVSPGSYYEIYAKLVQYSSLSKTEREKISCNARTTIVRNFSIQKLVNEMMESVLVASKNFNNIDTHHQKLN